MEASSQSHDTSSKRSVGPAEVIVRDGAIDAAIATGQVEIVEQVVGVDAELEPGRLPEDIRYADAPGLLNDGCQSVILCD